PAAVPQPQDRYGADGRGQRGGGGDPRSRIHPVTRRGGGGRPGPPSARRPGDARPGDPRPGDRRPGDPAARRPRQRPDHQTRQDRDDPSRREHPARPGRDARRPRAAPDPGRHDPTQARPLADATLRSGYSATTPRPRLPPPAPAPPRTTYKKPRKPPRWVVIRRGEPGRRLGITLLAIAFVLTMFAGRMVQIQGMESGYYRNAAKQEKLTT